MVVEKTDMEPDVGRLEALLRDRFRSLSGARELRIDPPLDDEEAADVLRGIENGLFAIEEDGYVSSSLLPPPRKDAERQKTVQLFWHSREGRFLFREGVCQIAAASALVLRYGWPEPQVRLEPYKEDVGKVAYGVDLVVAESEGGPVAICGEVKSRPSALRTLLRDMSSCGARGPHEKSECDPRNRPNHPKFEACLQLRPSYFWAVCPGSRLAFRVDYDADSFSLVEVPDIPTAYTDAA